MRTIRGWPGGDHSPSLELRRVEVAQDGLERLGSIVSELAPATEAVLVLQDDTPMRRNGSDLKEHARRALADAGHRVQVCELAGGADGTLHADFDRLEEVEAQLTPGVTVVALGSGTVTDLAKHACFQFEERRAEHLPLVFFPTALSVLAFAARMAVIAKDGVKRTWPSRLSGVLVFDLPTLAAAPRRLTLAGLGDLAPVFTASADWRLAETLGLARSFEPSLRILADVREQFGAAARPVAAESQRGLEMLAKMNVLGGPSATLAGDSAPLSGYEHVTGYMSDMGAEHFDRAMASHGAQVSLALIPHAIAFAMLLTELDPASLAVERCYPSAETMARVVRDAFAEIDPSGAMGEECWADYRQKLEAWHGAREHFLAFLAQWPARRDELAALLSASEQIVEALAVAGAPLRFSELEPPVTEQEGRWAFRHAHLMRKRFSAGDLYYLLGWLDAGLTDRVLARRDQLLDAARSAHQPRAH